MPMQGVSLKMSLMQSGRSSNIEERILELGLVLPVPPAPIAAFVPYTVRDNLVFVSGQLPMGPDGLRYLGKLGENVSLQDGQAAAALCALNLLAQLRAACDGNLDLAHRCLRLGVFVNAAPDFCDHPEVANGASNLIVNVMGEQGKHTRAAVGVSSLPRGVSVEVEGLFSIF